MRSSFAANTPHNPCRFADTVGIVIERVRPKGTVGKSSNSSYRSPYSLLHADVPPAPSADRLRWYCPNAAAHPTPHVIREVAFHCEDLGTQLKPLINVSRRGPLLQGLLRLWKLIGLSRWMYAGLDGAAGGAGLRRVWAGGASQVSRMSRGLGTVK